MEATARRLDKKLKAHGGRAFISVNKALVTQASSAIPVVPLYLAILYKLMKERHLHEGCIEQMYRLFQHIYHAKDAEVDDADRVRLDDWEMRPEIQAAVLKLWDQVNSDNIEALTDLKGVRQDFYKLFGFNVAGVDYSEDVDAEVTITSVVE